MRNYPFYAVGYSTFATKKAALNRAKKTGEKVYHIDDWRDVQEAIRRIKAEPYRATLNPSAPRFNRADITRARKLGESFTGHRYNRARVVTRKSPGKVRVEIGAVSGILYLAKRDGKVTQYLHTFAPGSRPLLTASPDGKMLELLGGAFRFTARGIVDRPVTVKRKRS